MNILFCSVGRRGKLIEDFKETMGDSVNIVATDSSKYAPALYLADKHYIVPLIKDKNYISTIKDICLKEKINAILTFIDPEIEVLAQNRNVFEEIGVKVLVPDIKTAQICFDKYEMYKYLVANNIKTPRTYDSIENFKSDLMDKKIGFPIFVKYRTGSGSVGAKKIETLEELSSYFTENKDENIIIQEYMDGLDLDADVYVDIITKKPVSIFTKKKLETKIGGASKTVSFKDAKLFEFIKTIIPLFDFNGPIDMDFFEKDGEYYLSEINPRFGGAYLHAYGAGVDFVKLIEKNINNIANEEKIGEYNEGVVMMMYDSVVIKNMNQIQ